MELDPLVEYTIDVNFKVGQSQLLEGEEFIPQFTFIGYKEGAGQVFPVMAPVLFESKEAKGKVRLFIKKMWNKILHEHGPIDLKGVLVAFDAYVGNMSVADWEKMGGLPRGGVKALPDNKEALVVQVSMESSELVYYWPYVRLGMEVLFAQDVEIEKGENDGKALFGGLWPL